jgi:epoxyqueuosine reductase
MVKAEAKRLGFDICGLAKAEPVDEHTGTFLNRWLSEKKNADMTYLANYYDKRLNPQLLVEGTRTVISVALNYYPSRQIPQDKYQIAWYAYGKDYHEIVKPRLQALLSALQQYYPTLTGRAFCDTAPVLERFWATKAGLGWIGKNCMLIVPNAGPCFFLGELMVNADADKCDTPLPDRCGDCTKCLNACPTGALEAPHELNASQCINYLTIENKNEISSDLSSKINNTIYGCNKCQAVCPWNKFAKPTTTPELQPEEALFEMTKEDWNNLNEEQYKHITHHSAMKRAKYTALKRNIDIACTNDKNK